MNRARLLAPGRGFALLTAFVIVSMLPAATGYAGTSQFGLRRNKNSNSTEPRRINEQYTAKIREYTTEPYFSTELVDHLPASDRVPSPDKILGYIAGTPEKLTYTQDLYRYYRELEKASPRVRVFIAPERSEEGKEQMLVLVSDEENLKRLDHHRGITGKLADPRRLSGDEEARKLIAEGKAFYWAVGAIHSPETGSPEMLMEMAYRLAVCDTPFIQEIRRNVIVMITPTLEVDGRDRMVDLYNYRKANPDKPSPPLLYWGKYVAHDNNRDGLGMALALTRNMMRTFLEYHPQVLHDLHESVPFLYTSTGTGPYNAWLDPLVIDEWHLLAYHEVEEMTKRGVPGVWTHGFYDGWAPNYMFYVANGHNSIGRFYETFGNGGADTRERTVAAQSQRAWFRPNPPHSRVLWSLRNNVNMQQSALLLAMNFVANNRERFLNNFYIKSKRSVAKAVNEGPAAYVIPGDTARPVEAADMVNLFRLMGIEVHSATNEFTIKDQTYPAGSYVVRMDQPYSRMADMMMDTQFYNPNDPRPYDDTGWTMGALRNVKTARITDQSILKVPMVLINSDVRIRGRIIGSPDSAGYVINHNTDNTLMPFRFKLKEVRMSAAQEPFKIGDQEFNAGSFIVKSEGNPADLRHRLETAAADLGITVVGVNQIPDVPSHEVSVPRIALVHTWTNTQDEGWYRIEFDRLGIDYMYISDHTIRDTPNLREKFDVILFPPARGSAQSIVNGMPKVGDPIPWKQSGLTPNIGFSPDQTDDMRGGMEIRGIANLQRFVEDGGLFIAITGNSQIPIDYGLVSGVSVQPSRQLQARGSIMNATFADRRSPISYGYDENLTIYFSQGPLFQISAAGGPGGGGGFQAAGAGGRPTGRGSLTDPDVVQAMPRQAPQRDSEQASREPRSPMVIPPEMRPRVVLRFVPDEKNLLVSGMLAGGSELAGRPAVIDVPVGRGHIVLFGTNPMWRHQTQGAFFLLFNAILHYDNLRVGRTRDESLPGPTEDDFDGHEW